MTKGHLAEYVKGAEKTKREYDDDDDDEEEEEEEEPGKRPDNRLVTSVIDAIHAFISRDAMTKNAIRVHIKRAQCVEKAFVGEVMLIVANEEDMKGKKSYELKFTDQDTKGVDAPHNDALVLIVNINTFDVKRVLIDPGSSLEIMYHSMFERMKLLA